jgi:hypothetical protein
MARPPSAYQSSKITGIVGYENTFSIPDDLEMLLGFKVSLQFGSDSLSDILRCTLKPVYVYCVVLIQGGSKVT